MRADSKSSMAEASESATTAQSSASPSVRPFLSACAIGAQNLGRRVSVRR